MNSKFNASCLATETRDIPCEKTYNLVNATIIVLTHILKLFFQDYPYLSYLILYLLFNPKGNSVETHIIHSWFCNVDICFGTLEYENPDTF